MNESIFEGELGMKAFDRRLFKNVCQSKSLRYLVYGMFSAPHQCTEHMNIQQA